MRQPKWILVLSSCEYRQMLHSLIHFRNKLIQQGKYPDAIDELLIKLQKARRYRHGEDSKVYNSKNQHFLIP